MIDTHCHLTFPEFAGRTAEILAAAREVGVRGAITISTTTADCLRTRDLALRHQHDHLWHSAGVHPLYSDQPLDWDQMREAAASPRCVAWGELGLDNHYEQPARDVQRKVLEEQLAVIEAWERERQVNKSTSQQVHKETALANSPQPTAHGLRKPLVLHCRDAFDDLISVLRGWPGFDPSRMVFHCFTGTPDDARKALDFGAWISFTGIVTFNNALGVQEAAKLVPVDRVMVETDSPFLTPEPMRRVRPNEPKYVVHVARRLADLRGVDPAEFEAVLDANAERFFGIRLPD